MEALSRLAAVSLSCYTVLTESNSLTAAKFEQFHSWTRQLSSLTMPPLPDPSLEFNSTSVDLAKRGINLNPFHYLTLPFKKNWDKVGPAINTYNHYSRIISILLSGLGLLVMLDQHNWKLPRWPWAKDGKNDPKSSYVHENERISVEELTEKKLMEQLLEMKVFEGLDEIPEGCVVPDPLLGDETVSQEIEGQMAEDTKTALDDILEQVEGPE